MQNTMTNFELSADSIHHIWQKGYSRVPNSILERKDLSAMAKICIAWLIGRPSGWHLVISQMCSALNISERQWSTAKKELITVGLFEQKKLKKPDGKYEWHHWWLTIPTLFKDGQAANDETMQHRPKLAQSFIASAVSKMTAENSTYDPVKTAEEFRKLGIKTQPPTLRDSPMDF